MSNYPKHPRCTLSPGFLLLAAFLFYQDDGSGIVLWTAAAATFHELGHIAAARIVGGRVEGISLSVVGAELRFCYPAVLTYGHECLVALAGPAVNLLFGVPLLWMRAYLPAMVSLGLGTFNLLPILPLDGGRILFGLVAERFGLDRAEHVLTVSTGIVVGLLVGAGAIAATLYANAVPMILAGWLLFGAMKSRKFSCK